MWWPLWLLLLLQPPMWGGRQESPRGQPAPGPLQPSLSLREKMRKEKTDLHRSLHTHIESLTSSLIKL